MKSLIFIALLSLLSACAESGRGQAPVLVSPEDPISQSLAQGLFEGEEWAFESARIEIAGGIAYFQLMDQAAENLCDPFLSSDRMLLFSMPLEEGEIELGDAKKVSFVGAAIVVAETGLLRIDSVGDGIARGGIYAELDKNNRVNGSFTAVICD